MNEPPKVYKDFKIYLTSSGGIATKYLVEQLKNEKIIKEQSSLSFFNPLKNVFVYAMTAPLNTEEIPISSQIDAKYFGKENVIRFLKLA